MTGIGTVKDRQGSNLFKIPYSKVLTPRYSNVVKSNLLYTTLEGQGSSRVADLKGGRWNEEW